MAEHQEIKNILSIAGADPSGGAGILADIKTFSALGCYGMAAQTALTVQNTKGVFGIHAAPSEFVRQQIDKVFEDIRVDAVKIGMAGDVPTIEAIAEALEKYKPAHVVLDPVMVAQSGDKLLEADAIAAMKERLIPLAHIITPNLPEAEILLGHKVSDPERAAQDLLALGTPAVFLKGGHAQGDEAVDFFTSGDAVQTLSALRINTANNHGTGCTLSAAIACFLAKGSTPLEACRAAKAFLTEALKHADQLKIGKGHGPVHHFYALWD